MFEREVLPEVADTLARLEVALDELVDLDVGALSREALLDLLRGLERMRRRSVVVDHQVIAEVDVRGIATELGCRDTAVLLRDLLRLTPGDARARVRSAGDLGPRRGLTGERLAALFPVLAEAQAGGVVSAGHSRVIVEAVTSLPATVEHEHGAAVERSLVEHARHLDPSRLAVIARRVVDLLDPDGTFTSDLDRERGRSVMVTANRDGSGNLRGRLTPECLAVWQSVLDPLAAPRPTDADGPDDRSPSQRLHDALLAAGRRLLESDLRPSSAAIPATVLITMTIDQLETRTGLVTTAHGGLLSVADALRIADQAQVVPTVLDAAGGVLAYGRVRRIASAGQRLALLARDGGCSFPGCDSPGTWDEVHHVVPWCVGGLTDVDNMTLLCGHHHREFERRGWSVNIADGVPEWLPPTWLDPQQRPFRRGDSHPVGAP